MIGGLSDSDFLLLDKLVLQPLKSQNIQVYIFGSRSRGDNHPFSDLDLLLVIDPKTSIKSGLLGKVKEDIEESNFPIKVDFVLDNELASSYRSSVEKDKKRI